MKSNKYSSEWIAQHDTKNASNAVGHLRKALKYLKGILSNPEDVDNAVGMVEKAIDATEAYLPYTPIVCSH